MVNLRWLDYTRRYGPALQVIAVGLVHYGSFARYVPFDYSDEGYVLYIAQQLLAGQRLYADIELFTYLPGLFYIFAGILKISGEELVNVHTVLALALTVNAWLAYRVVADHAGSVAGMVAAGLLMLSPGDWHRFYIASLNLALLLFAGRFLSEGNPRWLAALGIVTGLALGIRIDAGVTGIAIMTGLIYTAPFLYSSLTRMRVARYALIGFAIVTLPMYILFAQQGIFEYYLHQLTAYPAHFFERATAEYRLQGPALWQVWEGNTFARLYYASLVIPAAALWAFLVSIFRRNRDAALWLLILVWLACNLPQYLLERPDLTHLSHRTFVLFVIGMIVTGKFLRSITVARLGERLVQGAFAILVIIACSYLCIVMVRDATQGTYTNARHDTPRICLINGVCYSGSRYSIPNRLLDLVLSKAQPGEPVAVLPFAPGFSFLLRHPLPGPQVYLLPHSTRRDNAEFDYIFDLEKNGVRYLIRNPYFRFSRSNKSSFSSYAPSVHQFLSRCFDQVDQQNSWRLMVRNENTCPFPPDTEGGMKSYNRSTFN